MAVEWFLVNDGEEQGPFSAQQIKEFADSGRIKRTQRLRRADKSKTVRGEKVAGLFTALSQNVESASNKPISKRPPPLPSQNGTQPPPLPPTESPPLPYMQPPPLPPQTSALGTPVQIPAKKRRLNPNTTFLLGIWAGVGLCAAAFTFLAITGRFGPLVRWIETAAKERQTPETSFDRPASSVAEKDEEVESSSKSVSETPKAPKPNLNSAAFREGHAAGIKFGAELGKTLFIQGERMTEDDLRGDVDGVRQYDDPYPAGSRQAEEWLIGWEEAQGLAWGKTW